MVDAYFMMVSDDDVIIRNYVIPLEFTFIRIKVNILQVNPIRDVNLS